MYGSSRNDPWAAPQVQIRYRKHVDDMTPDDWKALGDAMTLLHQKDKFGPQGPATPSANEPFPQDHDSYEWFVQIHGNRKESKACKHGSELIWPWHRAFLLHFENQLRATNPPVSSNITLPYWDWTEKPSGEAGYPKEFEVLGSPFFHARQQYGTDIPLSVASDDIPQGVSPSQFVDNLMAGNWEEFGGTAEGPQAAAGAMESQLHNQIHGYIGKDNANTIHAVRDPIFWAHHANLDRLWDRWQRLHINEQQCFACDAPTYDRDPNMGALKFQDVLTNDMLPGGIKIAYLPKGSPVPQTLMTSNITSNEMMMPMDRQVVSTPQITAPENGLASYSFILPETSGYRFQLRLVELRVPPSHSYRGSVYLYPDNRTFSATSEFRKAYRIASFGVLANGNAENGHATQTVAIDLTDAFRNLPKDQVGKGWRLTIKFDVADKSLKYSDIAAEVSLGHIELQRRDFATKSKIQLR